MSQAQFRKITIKTANIATLCIDICRFNLSKFSG